MVTSGTLVDCKWSTARTVMGAWVTPSGGAPQHTVPRQSQDGGMDVEPPLENPPLLEELEDCAGQMMGPVSDEL